MREGKGEEEEGRIRFVSFVDCIQCGGMQLRRCRYKMCVCLCLCLVSVRIKQRIIVERKKED